MSRGRMLRAFAARLFDARLMARVIDPAIADLQIEPFSVTRYLAVVKTVVFCLPEASMRIGNVASVSAAVVVVVIALLQIPSLSYAWTQNAFDPLMTVYLVPQGLSIGLAIAVFLGTLFAFRGQAVTRKMAGYVLGVAMIVAAVSFVNAGWLTPIANQVFRSTLIERMGGGPITRGVNELTLGEVREQYAAALRAPYALDDEGVHFLAVSYHGRWAVTFVPVVFAIFALALSGYGAIVRWGGGIIATVAYLGYLLSMSVPRLPAMDGSWLGGAAWYPEVVLAAATVMLMLAKGREAHVAVR